MIVQDGGRWSEDADAAIGEAVLACFSTPAGERALAYLRKITTGRVLPPSATDAELRDLEGRRALVAIIDMRMTDARSRRAARPDNPDAGSGPAARGTRPSRASRKRGPAPA